MSVPKFKRTQSKIEYKNMFDKVVGDINFIISKVPKRRRKYICEETEKCKDEVMNFIYEYINLNNIKNYNKEYKIECIESAIEWMYKLDKSLIFLTSVSKASDNRITILENNFNKTYNLILEETMIYRLCKKDFKTSFNARDSIKKSKLLSKLLELNEITMQNVPKLKTRNINLGVELSKCIANAFGNAYEANSHMLKNKDDAEYRQLYFIKCKSSLEIYGELLMSLFITKEYDTSLELRWTKLLNECVKITDGIIASDRKRVKDAD